MSQRNFARQLYDLETEPGLNLLHWEPCVIFGNMVDFPNPSNCPGLPLSGNTANHDLRHPLDHHDSNIFYGGPYESLQHHHPVSNLDLGGARPSNVSYNPYPMSSSCSRICPMPLTHGNDYMAISRNHGIIGVVIDEYGRNQHIMDNVRGSCKRKNAEGLPGNYYYFSAPSSSSSSSLGIPLNSSLQPWEEPYVPHVGVLDSAALVSSEFRGSGNLSISEGSQRSVWSRSSALGLQLESSLVHRQGQLVQGNHLGQTFQPTGSWPEQFGNTGSDSGVSSWNYVPVPNMHGRNIGGSPLEIGSMAGQGYQDATSGRNSGIFLHAMHHQHQHPLQNQLQSMHNHNHSYHQVPAPPFRHSSNHLHHGMLNPSRDGLESTSRYSRPFSSNGERIYRPQRRAPQAVPDDLNRHMRLLSSDDVTMLEFSGFYGVGNFVDQHREMRLDIDDMSYEELLALEERIGVVSTGLSEETIMNCLKTRIFAPSMEVSPLDPPTEIVMEETGTCIICQVEYEENEKIGILDCGHDYHADCIKQWLLVKNICPICKASALSVDNEK